MVRCLKSWLKISALLAFVVGAACGGMLIVVFHSIAHCIAGFGIMSLSLAAIAWLTENFDPY